MTQTGNTGPGSLPVMINTANATPGDNVIEFSVAGTIGMVVPLPVITNSLTINGRSNIVISGGGVTKLFTFGAGPAKLSLRLVGSAQVRVAMTRQLMTVRDDPLYHLRIALCDPSEREERSAR